MNDKTAALTKYLADLKISLDSSVPEKHVNRPEAYRQFLVRELDTVTKKLDSMKLEGGAKK